MDRPARASLLFAIAWRFLLDGAAVALLTLLTEIGGVVWLAALLLGRLLPSGRHGIGKIFIEPHIPTSLGISSDNIRFQGCRAARHDDHIHIQLR